jgi:hypothetical protein
MDFIKKLILAFTLDRGAIRAHNPFALSHGVQREVGK